MPPNVSGDVRKQKEMFESIRDKTGFLDDTETEQGNKQSGHKITVTEALSDTWNKIEGQKNRFNRT